MGVFMLRQIRFSQLLCPLCALLCLTLNISPSRAADRPNILLIVAGDAIWLGIRK